MLQFGNGFAGDVIVKVAASATVSSASLSGHLDGRTQAAETFRSLVDQVTLVPDNGELAIVLSGDLGAILRFAAGKKNPDFLTEAEALDNLLSPGSLVAGARMHLDRTAAIYK